MSTSKIFLNYTDYHDVDENLRTISNYGGDWPAGNSAGVALRTPYDNPTDSGSGVASSDIQNIILHGLYNHTLQ